jgi:prevent-host-death family protein
MYNVPQIEPVTRMVRDHKALLEMTANGPVYLTQRGVEAAVLISAKEWKNIVRQLEMFEEMRRQARVERALKAHEEMLADPSSVITQEQYERMLAEAGLSE